MAGVRADAGPRHKRALRTGKAIVRSPRCTGRQSSCPACRAFHPRWLEPRVLARAWRVGRTSRVWDASRSPPARPPPREPDQEDPVGFPKPRALRGLFQDRELLSQGEEVAPSTLAAEPGFCEKKSRWSPTEVLCRTRSGCDWLLDRTRVSTIRGGRHVSIRGGGQVSIRAGRQVSILGRRRCVLEFTVELPLTFQRRFFCLLEFALSFLMFTLTLADGWSLLCHKVSVVC